MINKERLIQSTVAAFLTIIANHSAIATTADSSTPMTEKCYGLVKAGMNDCATAKSSCAGSATKDKQSDSFVLMPVGLCKKLVGAHLKSDTKLNKE